MKSIFTFAIAALSLISVPSVAAHTKSESVQVLSTKRYVFYFKVDKKLVGGTAEVLNADQQVVATMTLEHPKNIVDFFYLAPGTYTIKIKKGTEEFSFIYENKE